MNIDELRNEIDSIDSQLIGLFEKRMNVAKEIAQYKSENSLPVADKGRERDVLNRVTSCVSPEIEDYARSLYITVFELSRSYQKKLLGKKSALAEKIENALENSPETMPERATVACQGVEGSYSSLAGEKLFKYPTVMFFKNFEGVFAAVDRGLCKYGVLPIENSNAGSVNEVYDLMNKYNFYITRSIKLWISHSLLVNEGAKLENIKEIFSHRQAIEQCSDFLSGLDGVKVTVCENTAAAAKKVRQSAQRIALRFIRFRSLIQIFRIPTTTTQDLYVFQRILKFTQALTKRALCLCFLISPARFTMRFPVSLRSG